MKTYRVLAICGSTRQHSVNLELLQVLSLLCPENMSIEIYHQLAQLPHFNPDLDTEIPPAAITELRSKITLADGVIICTPEYVFSLPGALKNALEWMVSTVIFTDKPVALITASASGVKAHESLLLIMKTIQAKFTEETTLLISGAKGKIEGGEIKDAETAAALKKVIQEFYKTMLSSEKLPV